IIVSLVVTTIISLFLAFGLIRPLTKIEDAANRISKGDFSVDISYEGSDEIKSVVDAINYMSSQIQTNINQISGEKDKINALLSALPDGVIALNSDGQIQFLNTTALEFIDVSGEEAVGKNLFDLRQDPELKEFFDEGKEKDSLYTREISFPPNILKLHLIPYGEKTEIEPGMMMVIQDVTDLRRLEETRTSFLGAISHELRTPLTIIKGYLYTIIDEKQVQENELMQTALEVIDRETDRQSRLVSDLLELSRLRSRKLSIEMETVKIEDLVEETVNQLRTNAERMGISLQLFSNVQNIEIFADKDRMKQVFINLIDNAIKYTPQDGKVVVRTRQAPDFWEVEVEDTGMGIAKDELPFLFERFFRTKDKKKKKYIKGTGLGMAIVKEIVDAHRGIIDVSSREGEGTKILVKIPLNLKETIESERKSTD
ncbi:MAG: sensor histidine kinase, partial [Vulcanimicrobiota bacterium]